MLNKSPSILFNVLFNIPQGLVMTISVSLYQGITDITTFLRTFVCAFCAGVTLMLTIDAAKFGNLFCKLFHTKGKVLSYLVANVFAGALMGIFMNFLITWVMVGPTSVFPMAFLHTLPISIIASAISSCCWIALAGWIVGKVYPEKKD